MCHRIHPSEIITAEHQSEARLCRVGEVAKLRELRPVHRMTGHRVHPEREEKNEAKVRQLITDNTDRFCDDRQPWVDVDEVLEAEHCL